MADDIGGAGGAMRAVATLLIIVLILTVLYFSGFLSGNGSGIEQDGNIKTLSAPNIR